MNQPPVRPRCAARQRLHFGRFSRSVSGLVAVGSLIVLSGAALERGTPEGTRGAFSEEVEMSDRLKGLPPVAAGPGGPLSAPDMRSSQTSSQDIVKGVEVTVTDAGAVGFWNPLTQNAAGLGFRLPGLSRQLWHAGLILGTSEAFVSDAAYGTDYNGYYAPYFDFLPTEPLAPLVLAGGDTAWCARFSDRDAAAFSNAIGVDVTQATWAYDSETFAIVDYEITADRPISGLYVGLYADWDVGNTGGNDVVQTGMTAAGREFSFMRDVNLPAQGLYGTAVLGDPNAKLHAIYNPSTVTDLYRFWPFDNPRLRRLYVTRLVSAVSGFWRMRDTGAGQEKINNLGGFPDDIAIDEPNAYTYWVSDSPGPPPGLYWRTPLNFGTSGGQGISWGMDSEVLSDIVLDPATGDILIATAAGEIWNATTETLLHDAGAAIGDLKVDAAGTTIFWSIPGSGQVGKAGIDGASPEIIISSPGTPYTGLAIDGSTLYTAATHATETVVERWTTGGAFQDVLGTDSAADGTGGQLVLDLEDGQVFITSAGRLLVADLIGTGQTFEDPAVGLVSVIASTPLAATGFDAANDDTILRKLIVTCNSGIFWTGLEGGDLAPIQIYGAPAGGGGREMVCAVVDPRTTTDFPTAGFWDLFWTENPTGGTDAIYRANGLGSDLKQTLISGLSGPGSLAFDAPQGLVYWAQTGEIRRIRTDGMFHALRYSGSPDPYGGLALDVTQAQMYWREGGFIKRALTDGTNVQNVVPVLSSGTISGPLTIAVDAPAGKLWFSDQGKIWRANLADGSGAEVMVDDANTARSFVLVPAALAPNASDPEEFSGIAPPSGLDPARLYWLDASGEVEFAPLDDLASATALPHTFPSPRSLALYTGPEGEFEDADKYAYLSGNAAATTPTIRPADHSTLVVSGPYDLLAGQTQRVSFAMAGAGDSTGLAAAFAAAESAWEADAAEHPCAAPVEATATGVKMYWTDASPTIRRANLDGSLIEEITLSGVIEDIALDVAGGKMYWTDSFGQSIFRANLDGSDGQVLVFGPDFDGIALDVAAGKMYWTDRVGEEISRANLDGSDEEVLLSGRPAVGIALDAAGGKMYWTDPSGLLISRANFDGSAEEDLVWGLPAAGIALDVAGGKMYWTDASPTIRRANLDGSGIEDITLGGGIGVIEDIALDVAGGKMYWTDSFDLSMHRANLDGSNEQLLVFGPDFEGIAILAEDSYAANTPAGTNVPVELGPHLQLTFDDVSSSGTTQVVETMFGPDLPGTFEIMGFDPPVYFDVTTTAMFSGDVELCFLYDENQVTGPEGFLRTFHFEDDDWLDVTVLPVDTVGNVLCGSVTSLSPFAVVWDSAGAASTPVSEAPLTFQLHRAGPSPFAGRTTIRYDLPSASHVSLEIYDVAGRRVATLLDQTRDAGRHTATWDGTDRAGARVSSGVYFYRLRAADFDRTRRMVLLK